MTIKVRVTQHAGDEAGAVDALAELIGRELRIFGPKEGIRRVKIALRRAGRDDLADSIRVINPQELS